MSTLTELVRLEIPAQPAFVGVARSVVAAVAGTVRGLDEDRLEDLRLAVSEACTTAVEAQRSEAGETEVVIVCAHDGDALEVTIRHGGDGFDAASQREEGYGLQLIQALVDDVTFGAAGSGTEVRLRVDITASGDD